MSSLEVQDNDKTDTLCPVCKESIHGERPVGVTTGCGHCWHQQCYRKWQRQETLLLDNESSSSSRSLLNCLICQQPTRTFVDLFIRLPNACRIGQRKDLVTQLEHEFHTVSRRTQLSLERELARREFEQTWLQEERQLSVAARQKVEERHAKAVETLEDNLKELQVNFERKQKHMASRRKQQRRRSSSESATSLSDISSNIHPNFDNSPGLGRSIASLSVEGFLESSMNTFTSVTLEEEDSATGDNENLPSQSPPPVASSDLPAPTVIENETDTHNWQHDDAMLTMADAMPSIDTTNTTSARLPPPSQDIGTSQQSNQSSQAETGSELDNSLSLENLASTALPRTRRAGRSVQKDTIFYPNEEQQQQPLAGKLSAAQTRSRRSVLRDEIFAPTTVQVAAAAAPTTTIASSSAEDDRKLPAMDSELFPASSPSFKTGDNYANTSSMSPKQAAVSRKRKGSLGGKDHERLSQEEYRKKTTSVEDDDFDDEATAVRSVAEYERQRLQAETAYFQHQAELVEWERHQAEIELEQDELALQQREQRIRMERSLLEESFSSIQRRVRETKQEARDRQKLIVMEEKFVKHKAARSKEEKRFQNELEHLKQDDIQILERENSEKKRQEMEKVRLKKELNKLVKVMNELERCKEMVKLAEEQSSSSQSLETCVVCFEPLVNEESELGVAVPCGHTFHSSCFSGWEKSKRRRGASVPCPLCNVGTNLCVTIRMNRPASSLCFSSSSSSSSSSLARHFQKEEGRWQRRRLTGTELVGEEDLS